MEGLVRYDALTEQGERQQTLLLISVGDFP